MPYKDAQARKRYMKGYCRHYRRTKRGKQVLDDARRRYRNSGKQVRAVRLYQQHHPEIQRKAWKNFRGSTKDKKYRENARLLHLYGITLSDKRKMYRKQKGLCLLCGRKLNGVRKSHVDHSHETDRVRGL